MASGFSEPLPMSPSLASMSHSHSAQYGEYEDNDYSSPSLEQPEDEKEEGFDEISGEIESEQEQHHREEESDEIQHHSPSSNFSSSPNASPLPSPNHYTQLDRSDCGIPSSTFGSPDDNQLMSTVLAAVDNELKRLREILQSVTDELHQCKEENKILSGGVQIVSAALLNAASDALGCELEAPQPDGSATSIIEGLKVAASHLIQATVESNDKNHLLEQQRDTAVSDVQRLSASLSQLQSLKQSQKSRSSSFDEDAAFMRAAGVDQPISVDEMSAQLPQSFGSSSSPTYVLSYFPPQALGQQQQQQQQPQYHPPHLAAAAAVAAASAHTSHFTRNLLRTFAPVTALQLHDVEVMVELLKKELAVLGATLPIKKASAPEVHDGKYLLGNKKVNLAVVGNRLVVRSGGGVTDFLEYMEKTRFH